MRRRSGVLSVVALVAVATTGLAPAAEAREASLAPDDGASISRPVRDDVYPQVGNTLVDALHYDLGLRWQPASHTLTGEQTLRFRATRTAGSFELDLAAPLAVGSASVDGRPVRTVHRGDKLVVHQPVRRDARYELRLHYRGQPEPILLGDPDQGQFINGWLRNDAGEGYTTQEPYGAYGWYAANDHPSDKATYDFRLSAPRDRRWVGVANGRLLSRTDRGSQTLTHWRLDSPASSYLTTAAIGPYLQTKDRGRSGVPISYWTARGRPDDVRQLRYTPTALQWLEQRLGRYPFSSLGILVAPEGGMETQTMITLGRIGGLSPGTLVHEIAHQWFGDEVSPRRWSDVWLNEGLATYFGQVLFAAQGDPVKRDSILAGYNRRAPGDRLRGGPPARPRPETPMPSSVYFIPALMWDLVRQQVGDARFMKLAGDWARTHRYGHADYRRAVDWWSAHSGRDLRPLFHAWLVGQQQPSWSPKAGARLDPAVVAASERAAARPPGAHGGGVGR